MTVGPNSHDPFTIPALAWRHLKKPAESCDLLPCCM